MAGIRYRSFSWGALAVVAFVASLTASAASSPSVLNDPVGDAKFHAPAYMDIVRAEVTETDGTFQFLMELAGVVPGNPSSSSPPGSHVLVWAWGLAKDSKPYPRGYPFAPGYPDIGEVIVGIVWDGTAFAGTAIDRRPNLTGGEVIVTAVDFVINRSEVIAKVDAANLGDPSSFRWGAFTVAFHGPFGASSGYQDADAAVWAVWSS